MAIPQFQSEDLAKLVLGYLADEQLMIVYDEFLQASPYLDARTNEYGRILMKSLKDIVREYMDVKIHLERCKPVSLRKKLLQCSNVLEIVKFLFALVDVQKLNLIDTKGKQSLSNELPTVTCCDTCCSLNIRCSCALQNSKNSQTSAEDPGTITIETTLESDISGDITVKNNDYSENIGIQGPSHTNCDNYSDQVLCENAELHQNNNTITSENVIDEISTLQTVTSAEIPASPEETNEIIEEFVSASNFVSTESTSSRVVPCHTVAIPNAYPEFNNCPEGFNNDGETNSDNCGVQYETQLDFCGLIFLKLAHTEMTNTVKEKENKLPMIGLSQPLIKNIKGPPKILHRVTTYPKALPCGTPSVSDSQCTEQKITILSDIKVDNTYQNNMHPKIPPVLKAITSTPTGQMQAIYTNGTPVYNTSLSSANFSKDEIMAMPTIILVPTSGISQPIQASLPQNTLVANVSSDVDISKSMTARVLRPLGVLVDVNYNGTIPVVHSSEFVETVSKVIEKSNDVGSIKTIDLTTGSLPKETTSSASLNKISTPPVLPPTRKSSSTPRRTSHVRVLDFTTPRRILNEGDNNRDLIDSTALPCNTALETIEETNEKTNDENDNNKTNHNKMPTKKVFSEKKGKPKKNWDADLRALAVTSDHGDYKISMESVVQKKPKEVKVKRTNEVKKSTREKKCNQNKNISPKSRKIRKKSQSTEITVESDKKQTETTELSGKPILTISVDGERSDTPTQESDTNFNNGDNNIETADTPEAERLALQNVIGAKLNISELLETPYKQALYDIQMETPRFLGPDLPGEPMSDIKIMNIPTPRFFDTPNHIQATPSSYSSRPTDYSSGGSYYKPDDQDYIAIDEVLECAITLEKNTTDNPLQKEKCIDDLHEKPKRPVRKCTKNVSYSNNSNVSYKIKEDLKSDTPSSSSDLSNHSIIDKSIKKKLGPKVTSNKKMSKKIKEIDLETPYVKISPLKRDKESQKSFMKIKPKRTPIKESIGKRSRKFSDKSRPGVSKDSPLKRRLSIKDKIACTTPAIVAAPTKSRRKSATPRKLNCTSFNSNSSSLSTDEQNITKVSKSSFPHDSDNDQPPLRWSDDGSQDVKSKDSHDLLSSQTEDDDIDKIKKYIENTELSKSDGDKENNKDLCRTTDKKSYADRQKVAKTLEEVLCYTPPRVIKEKNNESFTTNIENDNKNEFTNTQPNENQDNKDEGSVDNEDNDEEIELTVNNCTENTKHYITYKFDENTIVAQTNAIKLKDKFCIEVCIDDGTVFRLNATPLCSIVDMPPKDNSVNFDSMDTAAAVCSISHIDKLYTPQKDPRAQCIEIFDSTLTSLDTPLKIYSPKEREFEKTITEIVSEVETIEYKDRAETRKRKRNQSIILEESVNTIKKARPEEKTQYLLTSANIQNMDIESVLSKLHGN